MKEKERKEGWRREADKDVKGVREDGEKKWKEEMEKLGEDVNG